MPAKKKSLARKLKVELKDLRPRKDTKGGLGGAESQECVKGVALTKGFCSGVVG
jgi:hypothetical protein